MNDNYNEGPLTISDTIAFICVIVFFFTAAILSANDIIK